MLVGAGVLGALALGGLITGLTVANNPAAPTRPHLISTFQYVGSRTSPSFRVPSSATTARYQYRCPRGPSSFNARMQNSSGSDVQHIVTTSGSSGGPTTVPLHPKHPGTKYHLAVSTTCQYRVQVYSK